MSFPPSLRLRFERASAALPRALGTAALVLGLWLGLIRFPAPPAIGLDPSWRIVIGHALEHGWQFGTDIVFTYGPLGFLLGNTHSGSLYPAHLVWQLGANLLLAGAIVWFGRGFRGWRAAVYYLYFFALGVGYIDVVHMFMVLLGAYALSRPSPTSKLWIPALVSAALAVVALIKFTNLMLGGFALACVLALHLWQRRAALAAVIAGTFALAFLGGWLALGQSLAHLPAYVVNSLAVSSGYVAAMGLEESAALLAVGLAAGLALLAYLGLTVVRATDTPRALALALIAAAAAFLNWKHGFVRADGHVLAHFFMVLFFVCAWPARLEETAAFRRAKSALLGLAAALSLAGIWLNSPPTLLYFASTLNTRLVDHSHAFTRLPDLARNARLDFEQARRTFNLPGIRALVGDQTVDILGSEQAYAVLNGLNYRPRPSLQTYAAYNEHLVRLNGDFYASDRAPEFVLQKIQPIDSALPAAEDALATRYLYHHYRFLMQEQDFLVWKRENRDPALDVRAPLSTHTIRLGESLRTPNLVTDPVWMELDLRPSLLGRLREFFYKPPQVRFAAVDGGGFKNGYRLIPSRGRAGFLVNPHFTSTYNVVQYERGGAWPALDSFSLQVDPADRKYFQPEIAVRFYRLPPFPRYEGAKDGTPPEVLFRMFNRLPFSASAYVPLTVLAEHDKEVLFAHPPSEIAFQINYPARHVAGQFGLIDNSWTPPNKTDGVQFILEWIGSDGRVTPLIDRTLKPATVEADRGRQSFLLDLPQGGGTLRFRTTPGPNGDIGFDWAYWTDVKIGD